MFEPVHKDRLVIESYPLDEYVSKLYGKRYSSPKGADANNESFFEYEISLPSEEDGELWFATEDTMEDHKEALENWEGYETSPDPRFILNELCLRGLLLEGKYVLLISY